MSLLVVVTLLACGFDQLDDLFEAGVSPLGENYFTLRINRIHRAKHAFAGRFLTGERFENFLIRVR